MLGLLYLNSCFPVLVFIEILAFCSKICDKACCSNPLFFLNLFFPPGLPPASLARPIEVEPLEITCVLCVGYCAPCFGGPPSSPSCGVKRSGSSFPSQTYTLFTSSREGLPTAWSYVSIHKSFNFEHCCFVDACYVPFLFLVWTGLVYGLACEVTENPVGAKAPPPDPAAFFFVPGLAAALPPEPPVVPEVFDAFELKLDRETPLPLAVVPLLAAVPFGDTLRYGDLVCLPAAEAVLLGDFVLATVVLPDPAGLILLYKSKMVEQI